MASPTIRSHGFALQKYLLLQEQHETLCQHVDRLRHSCWPSRDSTCLSSIPSPTTASAYSADSSPYSSRSSSESRGRSRRVSIPASLRSTCASAAPMGLDTVLDESTLDELASEEAKLLDVNEGIKRALTELLNCDEVRSDGVFRTWVQGRLMTAERELRASRRHKNAPVEY